MSEITRGVIGMPFKLAMGSEMSRRQFHACAQEVFVEKERLEAQVVTLKADPNSWQSGYDEGRKMGTKTALSERDQLRAENESLRKQIADASPFKNAPMTGRDLKCLACGGYHYGMENLPCPNMRAIAQAAGKEGQP
jgi:hypothetical protein